MPDRSVLQALNDGGRIDHGPAAGVDEHGTMFHARDRGGVDQMPRRIGQRAVERHDVGLAQQRIERRVRDPHRRTFGIGHDVVCDHLAPETEHDPGDPRADAPRADDPDRPAVEVEAQQAIEREIAFANACIGTVDVAIERQDECDRMLGHRFRRIGGDARDGDAERLCSGEVDIVEPGRPQGHDAYADILELPQNGCVDLVVHEDADRIGALGQDRGFGSQPAFHEVQDVGGARRGFHEHAVVGFGAEHGDDHRLGLCDWSVSDGAPRRTRSVNARRRAWPGYGCAQAIRGQRRDRFPSEGS